MKIKDLFKRDIGRSIETVIKADDREHVFQEVNEYVVTQEIARKIRDFFSEYINYETANGVWISGFFGSGKSHLLKILSYVLENKEYDGMKLGEVFAKKIVDDEMLKADVLAASRIPSESVLFNIDQQAQITTKQEDDAVLNVFYKVFYDQMGYYGTQPHIARFEWWIDREGVYSDFRQHFEELLGEPWIAARRKYFDPKVKNAVAKSLAAVFNNASEKYEKVLDEFRIDNKHSVDDFCEKVKEYVDSKERGFRLNFFVDEVGQYISDNTKLMLNLQTIAETLAVKTKGKSWILVTSQEDMEKVIGDLNARQQNDFSRIQARFMIKIPLTSANVDEVIEKRLLDKNDEAQKLLSNIWKSEEANLGTIFTFSETGVQFKGFKNESDFVNKYPFVAYQFDLFQQCIKSLSVHNAFQGRHASVGERSMLGVFQEVVKKISDNDSRALISFDLLFDGLRSTIRSEIQSAVSLAERQIDSEFAVKVLKALFLVKYYTNFKTTARNVQVLMIDHLDVDLKKHEEKVQTALNLLETQSYIQRNGDLYVFLTNEEKDIEEEIKSTEINTTDITRLFKEILFDEIIRDTRVRFSENKQDYEFTPKIDGAILGREKELAIDIITPNHDEYGNENFYKAQTMGYNTLLMMVLPPDDRLMKDVRMYLKTDSYVRKNQSLTNTDNIKRILFDKSQQNNERRKNLVILLKSALAATKVYLNGTMHQVNATTDGKTKVIYAFQDLVKIAYPSLRMIGGTLYSEDTVKNTLRSRQDDLFGTDDAGMSEAESEVLMLAKRRKAQSERTSLTDLKEHFTHKPYGWYDFAIFTITARLYKRGKIEMRQDANLLDEEQALNAFMNNRLYGNTLIEPQEDIDQRYVRKLKEIYNDFFNEPCPVNEARDVANAFKEKLKAESLSVNQLLVNKNEYPFLESLEPLSELLSRLSEKEYSWLLNHIDDYEDQLLDDKEDLLDPIKRFWHGSQKKIYDSIRTFIEGDRSNLEYVEGDELNILEEVYNHPKPYSGDLIKQAKTARDTLAGKILKKIEEEKERAVKQVEANIRKLKKNEDFGKLTDVQQEELLQPFKTLKKKIEYQRYIANIRQTAGEAEKLLGVQLNKMMELLAPESEEEDGAAEPRVHYISKDLVKVDFPKSELKTEEDVHDYVKKLEEELLKHIRDNRRISL
jgi:hypothetical protein